MRILTFTSLFPNSVQPNLGIFVYQRMRAFAERNGNSVEVIAPLASVPDFLRSRKYKELSVVPEKVRFGAISVHHPRYPFLPGISMPVHAWLMYRGSIALARKLHRENPFTCVDAHFVYPDGKAGLLIGKALGIPTIVSARGSDINLFPQFKLIRPQIQRTLEEAAGRIAVCEALKTAVVRVAGTKCEVRVIGNGVDRERFYPVDSVRARAKLGLPTDTKIIVSVAALIEVKGQEFLIRALNKLKEGFPNLHLYLIGEGTYRQKLEEIVAALGLQGYVHFVGSRPNDDLRYWYSAADVFCLASEREGWPNVLLESLACGTPVVATRVWGTPEVISSPDLGILVDRDIRSLIDGITAALGKKWDRNRLVDYALTREWSKVGEEVESYFKSVIERTKSRTVEER